MTNITRISESESTGYAGPGEPESRSPGRVALNFEPVKLGPNLIWTPGRFEAKYFQVLTVTVTRAVTAGGTHDPSHDHHASDCHTESRHHTTSP